MRRGLAMAARRRVRRPPPTVASFRSVRLSESWFAPRATRVARRVLVLTPARTLLRNRSGTSLCRKAGRFSGPPFFLVREKIENKKFELEGCAIVSVAYNNRVDQAALRGEIPT